MEHDPGRAQAILPLYLAGARLLEVFPLLNLIGNVSLGVAALTYTDQFNIMAVADRDAYPTSMTSLRECGKSSTCWPRQSAHASLADRWN